MVLVCPECSGVLKSAVEFDEHMNKNHRRALGLSEYNLLKKEEVERIKIDVVLLTKDSLKPCLKECLDSIYSNTPVNRLIVVDGGSKDGTLELVKGYLNAVIIDDTGGTRATARQKGIEAVETEWHLHVDSDVILCRNWFRRAGKFIAGNNVGAIWGVAIPTELHTYNRTKAMSKFYKMPVSDLLVKQIRSERYMTHDTLFRTDLLKDIKIPSELHIWEDDYIGKWVIKKGYKFLKVKDPYCFHNLHLRRTYEDNIVNGYLMHKYGVWSFRAVLLRFLLAIPKAVWIYVITRDFVAARGQIQIYVLTMKGWLMA
jgi:glycosyltransferase involved in cell wall biosynthesis/uncharacterized C2H2 Zn-finger protein